MRTRNVWDGLSTIPRDPRVKNCRNDRQLGALSAARFLSGTPGRFQCFSGTCLFPDNGMEIRLFRKINNDLSKTVTGHEEMCAGRNREANVLAVPEHRQAGRQCLAGGTPAASVCLASSPEVCYADTHARVRGGWLPRKVGNGNPSTATILSLLIFPPHSHQGARHGLLL